QRRQAADLVGAARDQGDAHAAAVDEVRSAVERQGQVAGGERAEVDRFVEGDVEGTHRRIHRGGLDRLELGDLRCDRVRAGVGHVVGDGDGSSVVIEQVQV